MKSSIAGKKNAEAVPEELGVHTLSVVKPIYILETELLHVYPRAYYCNVIQTKGNFVAPKTVF